MAKGKRTIPKPGTKAYRVQRNHRKHSRGGGKRQKTG